MKPSVRKLALAGILIAVGVVCSPFSFPVGASKCFPIQHMVNVLAAVLLGPFYGVAMAFVTSLLRVLLGTGSLLAFPGSMCGALFCGLAFRFTGKRLAAYAAEVLGTSVAGGLLAYPVAVFFMAKEAVLFAYVLPFLVSTVGGTCIAAVLIAALERTRAIEKLNA